LIWILCAYAVSSALAFGLYGLDKARARRGGARVPESRLHLVELLGGWPGALLGQRRFRHKTRKRSYQLVFWLIGALHLAAWLTYLQMR
jgi:uncharacterized membrane protein YsdA (DUF1294 family)